MVAPCGAGYAPSLMEAEVGEDQYLGTIDICPSGHYFGRIYAVNGQMLDEEIVYIAPIGTSLFDAFIQACEDFDEWHCSE